MSLHLYRLFSQEAFEWPLESDSVTLCCCFGEEHRGEVENLHAKGAVQLNSHNRPTTFLISVYIGAEQSTGFEWVEEQQLSSYVFWAGPEGFESEVCQLLGVTETPTLLVLQGSEVVQRLSEFPEDLGALVPSPASPSRVTETFTYESLAEYLRSSDPSQVTSVYQDVSRFKPHISLHEVATIISTLSDRLQLDLSSAVTWFASPRYGSDDFEDVIDLDDITEEMFVRRLRNFCAEMSKGNEEVEKGEEEVGPGNYEELKGICRTIGGFLGKFMRKKEIKEEKIDTKPDMRDTQIANLTAQLLEKDALISRLTAELASKSSEITDLQFKLESQIPVSKVKTPQSRSSLHSFPTAQSAPVSVPVETLSVAVPKDEFDFWKYGQEEEWDSAQTHPPKFEEIAAAKGLWIVTAETQGIGPSIKDLRMLKQQAKSRKGALPPLANAPGVPERRIGSQLAAKKTNKPIEKFGSAGKLVAGKG